jgi:hypothetical protein
VTCAPDAIAANQHFALWLWAAAAAIVVVLGIALHRKRASMLGLIPMIAGAVMHPAWWMSSTRGDCGDGLHELAFYYTASVAVIAAVIYWLTTRSR